MVWAPRQSGHAIGRIYNCGTRAGDHFYLCLLLTHVKGPESEQHLHTVDGVQHATCKAACVALGLLEDDGEWHQCLAEACQVQVGASVRRLFAVILAYNATTHPLELWLAFNRQMCDDLLRWRRYPLRQTSTDEQVLDYGLYLIQQHLAERTSIYMTLLQTCLKLWENGTQSRIITTSSSRDSLSLMQTTSKPYWTLQSITLTLDNKLLLMLSPMPIRILPRLSSCSSSMDQV